MQLPRLAEPLELDQAQLIMDRKVYYSIAEDGRVVCTDPSTGSVEFGRSLKQALVGLRNKLGYDE